MNGRSEQEHLFREAARRELAAGRIDRREFLTRSLSDRSRTGRRRNCREIGHRACFRRRPSPDADLLSVDPGPASGDPGGEREVPGHQLPDRAGRRLRDRAFRRRGQEQAKHVGRLCRPDAVRRNVGLHQGRRDRAVGQLHSKGRDRRHHPVDPRGMHCRRQAIQLAVPPRRDRLGLAFGHHQQGGRAGRCARDLGRVPRQLEEDRRFEGCALGRDVRRPRLALARADHPQHEHESLYAGRSVRLHQRARRSRP